MKRVACLVLLLVVLGVFSPFVDATPTLKDTQGLVGKRATISRFSGLSKLVVEPSGSLSDAVLEVEDRGVEIEYNWILASPPASNVFALKLTLTNCEYYYQPPLTEEYTAASAEARFGEPCTVTASAITGKSGKVYVNRPEDIVGSYAVYSTYSDGVYETGKVAHIYRPLVTDAKGKTTWGTMNISGDTLTVTVNQKWLDTATYPVTVDPTFGFIGIGGSDAAVTASQIRGTKGTGAIGAVQSITAYAEDASSDFKGVIVKVSDLTITTNGVSPAQTVPASAAWATATYTTAPGITAQDYYVCVIFQNAVDKLYYDTGAAAIGLTDSTNVYATPTDPTDGTPTTSKWSIYATYYTETVSTPNINDLNDADNLYAMKQYYSFNATTTNSLGATAITAVSMKLTNSTGTVAQVKVTGLDGGSPTWSIISGSGVIDLDTASCTWTENVNVGTAIFEVRAEWDIPAEADYDLAASFLDTYNYNTTWTTATNSFDVITRLVTRDLTGNVTGTTAGSGVLITGGVRYATTVAGDNASSSYPPNAAFTSVKIYTGESEYAGMDTSIANGAFSVAVTAPSVLGTTYYYVWIDMAGDYVDGLAPDGDYFALSVTSSFYLSQLIEQAATLFSAVFPGFASFLDGLSDMTSSISAFFGGTVTSIVSGVSMVFKIMVGFAVFALDWGTRIANWVVDITTEVLNIFNGTSAAATGLGNIWTLFNVSSWIDFIPLMLILFWLESLDVREKKQGGGWVQIAIGDIQIATYILGLIMEYSWMVFNFVFNTIVNLASLIPGL